MNEQAPELKWVGKRIPRPDGVDKVTGRAQFGADLYLPNMLEGKILRSPHAHARIKSIDVSKAKALPGVKAVITSDDIAPQPSEMAVAGEIPVNFRDLAANLLANGKVLYDGHAVAAVAATSALIANEALSLIEVDYEVLPHVTDVEEAMKPDAPVLHDYIFTENVEPKPDKPSNIASRMQLGLGDVDAGFKEADIIIERRFESPISHQGYIEPHAAVADWKEDGQSRVWCSSQGQFMVRGMCAKLLDVEQSSILVTPSEVGGAFGGKTVVYLEPLALIMSRIAGRPVRMVMSRDEVLRATGPTSGAVMEGKIGAKKDGTITAIDLTIKGVAGAFPGGAVGAACMTAFTSYNFENSRAVGYDVVNNTPKTAAYRGPGAPISALAVESLIDEVAQKTGIDPIDLRLKHAAREGTPTVVGAVHPRIGCVETLEAAKAHPHYSAPLGPNQGRGVATGYWFCVGGQSSAAMNINDDGTATVVVGTPDLSGNRASLSQLAAEVLGIDPSKVQVVVGDTASIASSMLTGGSRQTFAVGTVVMEAAGDLVDQLRGRAAMIWEVDVEGVDWKDGQAVPASSNVGTFDPLSLADLAAKCSSTGGPVTTQKARNVSGEGATYGTHIADVEVDPETGRVTLLRYTVCQDVGKAVHPSYVEGQMQGGASQGIGWALNEEYIYGADGKMENSGFLDYRMPVASDLPMIDTVIVEVPNPNHPYGVRGCGEIPIIPPLGTLANAVSRAIGKRATELPLSPPRVLKIIES